MTSVPLDHLHSGDHPNPYRPVPSYRIKGLVGYKPRTLTEKPRMVRFMGEIWSRSERTKVYKEATTRFRQWRARRCETRRKQARKYNRRVRLNSHIDLKRLRGRRTGWGQ